MAAVRYQYTSIRITKNLKTDKIKYTYIEMWSTWTVTHFWLVCKIVIKVFWKTACIFLIVIHAFSILLRYLFLGIYPREMKVCVHIKTCMRMLKTVLFIIAINWKQPKCLSVDKWINKLWYIYIMKYSTVKMSN